MKVSIELETENDAFKGDFEGELGRVLRRAKAMIEHIAALEGAEEGEELTFKLKDTNGNTVGLLEVTL